MSEAPCKRFYNCHVHGGSGSPCPNGKGAGSRRHERGASEVCTCSALHGLDLFGAVRYEAIVEASENHMSHNYYMRFRK